MNLTDQALVEAPSMIFRTLAEAHDFDLMHLSASEAHRLSGFLSVLDQAKYPRLQTWPEKVFLSARLSCQIELQRMMQIHGIDGSDGQDPE